MAPLEDDGNRTARINMGAHTGRLAAIRAKDRGSMAGAEHIGSRLSRLEPFGVLPSNRSIEQHGEGKMSAGAIARNTRNLRPEKDHRNLQRRPIEQFDDHQFTTSITVLLNATYGRGPSAAKVIANDTGATPRAARNWLEGLNAPSALHLLRLCAANTVFAAEVRRLTGMEADLDPNFGRAFNDFMIAVSRSRS